MVSSALTLAIEFSHAHLRSGKIDVGPGRVLGPHSWYIAGIAYEPKVSDAYVHKCNCWVAEIASRFRCYCWSSSEREDIVINSYTGKLLAIVEVGGVLIYFTDTGLLK